MRHFMSLDVLLLLALIPAQMYLSGEPFLLVVPLLLYIMLELAYPLSSYRDVSSLIGRARLAFLARWVLLLVMISGACLVPAVRNIAARQLTSTDKSDYNEIYSRIHDGAIQMESAIEFLDQGKNPYVERYDNTLLRYYSNTGISLPTNPAFDYFVYLLGYLVLSFPVYKVFNWFHLPYDQRVIYLATYFLLILFVPLLASPPLHKLTLIAAVGLNPLITDPVIIGMNDIVVLLAIVLTTIALGRKKLLLSALFFGLAVTFKQSAWFVAPFYLLFILNQVPNEDHLRKIPKLFMMLCLVPIVIIGPFFFWNVSAFVTDVVMYPVGLVGANYPIVGFTLGTLLVGAGLISSPLDSFPFWIFQLLFGVPLLLILLRYQSQRNSIGLMLFCAGLFIFAFGFLSRFFQSNYVGFVTVLLSLGYLLDWTPPDQNQIAPA